MSLERQALELQRDRVREGVCDMPAAFALLFGGPSDGTTHAVDPNLSTYRVPLLAPLPDFLSETDPTPTNIGLATAEYHRGSWVTLTHNMPWCQKTHEVIEYRYASHR